jgi:hypothetical protein
VLWGRDIQKSVAEDKSALKETTDLDFTPLMVAAQAGHAEPSRCC